MSPPDPAGGRGCWPAAFIIVGGLITLLSGLCTGGSIVGGIIDVANGDATVSQALGPVLPFVSVGGPFLAGGIALVVWGIRIQKRNR